MAPAPQEHTLAAQVLRGAGYLNSMLKDNAVVISGMSGMYPQSESVKDLSDILYNKVNPISSEGLRWNFKHPEITNYAGIAPGVEYFDAQFFTIYHRLGNCLDPMARKLLEHTYQAIYDAGLCPADLNGRNIGVFIGSSFSDSEYKGIMDYCNRTGLGIIGTNKAMFSNRISYWLNVKGPSLHVDEMDCSVFVALEQAILALNRGDCEAAIVGGARFNLHPYASIYHNRFACQSADGKTKSFSVNSDGYTLSDAVGVFFLQKKKDALRVYAEVKHVKNEFISMLNDGTDPKFGYCRNPQVTAEFIKQFYKEAQVPPQDIEYVEAYGTAVPDADKAELEAIAEVYCKDREEPLMVGSVTSNIGITEAAFGHTGIVKVLLGFSNGLLPANLNCDEPRQDIDALRDGRIRILTDHQQFRGTYAAVNGMSFTGINSHVLLHSHYKQKDLSRYQSAIPRLVTISGRQESAVQRVFDNLKSKTIDAEELALLHNIHSKNISGHLGRGCIILDADENQNTVSLAEKIEFFDDARRPLWFVYSGMGSQWAGMGTELMCIPVFAAAIERCQQVLKPRGLDIVEIITTSDKSTFDNILHSFVGIAAVQIGLTDILNEMDLVPDGIIGHSVGELGCAYADGCLTTEEMILSAYSRGLASLETPLIRGSMAAVGLGYEEMSKICPPEIDVACRNSADSSTISGPADIMCDFVAQLTASGVFAKEVPCSNIAYHSRYIKDAGPNLLKYLKEVIKHPKPRSERWVSTSVSQDKWSDIGAKHSSAEYHTNNLLSPVLFEETTRLIPNNAVLVEVAPHGLLQAILKRAMPDCIHVPLTKRGHRDNALYFLQAIGDLYMTGYLPKIQALYPKVEFPVSTGTPMLSHLIEWVHIETWDVATFKNEEMRMAAAAQFMISVHDEEHKYLRGNVIREKMCYSYASALIAVWDTLMMTFNLPKRESSVQFRDIHLYSQPLLQDQRALRLEIRLHRGTRLFEVMNKRSRVISGYVLNVIDRRMMPKSKDTCEPSNMKLSSKDVYQLFEDRDYNYSDEFRSIECASPSLSEAMLLWQDNWATLIDGMLQLNTLRQPHHSVSLPTHIRKLCIDVKEHVNSHARIFNNKRVMEVNINDLYDQTTCGGITLQHIKFRDLPPVSDGIENLKLVVPPAIEGFSTKTKNIDTNNTLHQTKLPYKRSITLQSTTIGNLDSLHWVEAPKLDPSGLTVEVHYTGINMLDVKRATGILSNESSKYGMDYSGVTNTGEHVMGIVYSGAASTRVQAQLELLWPVPAHWSLEDAATVPLAYGLAFYCLKIKGGLTRGMRALVHGGSGATGQAAISILLAHNCRVFATVSDVRKKQFLQKLYPQLKDEDILYSRDSYFAAHVKYATQEKGLDIIISCLKGSLKNVSMGCLGLQGCYIDTVQVIERESYEFVMSNMLKGRQYFTIDMPALFTYKKYDDMKRIQIMLAEGIAGGYVRPLARVTYAPHEVTRAFRLLATSRHRSRVLLRMQESATNVQQRIVCDPNRCHVIFCYNDVIGVQLVERLINRGANKIYLHAPYPAMYYQFKTDSWRKLGTEVTLSSENLTDSKAVTSVLSNATRMGKVEGIYITTDKGYSGRNKDLTRILNNIDLSSRSLCPQLRYFAVVSTDGGLAQHLSLSRAASGYAATTLDLSCLSDVKTTKTRIPSHLAVEATERAICSPYTVLQAKREYKLPPSLMQQVAALAGIEVAKNTNTELTLRELGMAEEKIPSIDAFLNVNYNISLMEDEIPLLNSSMIAELEKSSMEIIYPRARGLATFFSKGSADELFNTTDYIVLPTMYKEPTLSQTEFDVDQRYLCIVPGMEGHNGRFPLLCERLKLPAVVLQTGHDHPNETVPEMGQRFADILINKNMAQKNFYLLGYESGVMVALEMAAILENNGFTGTIFLMGYDPEELQMELEEQLSELATEKQLEDALVRHFYKIMAGEHSVELDDVLQTAATWAQKVDTCVRYLRGRTTHSIQYTRAFLETALARIKQVRSYKTIVRPLRSRLVFLRAASARTSHDYLKVLQRNSIQQVAIHQLSAPLAHATYDIQSSAIVNKYLDIEIQKAFENRSQCDSYPVNQRLTFQLVL